MLKKTIAIILLIIVTFSVIPITAGAVSYKAGDIVTIGSYPQTRVTDSALISSLNSVSKTWKGYPYYEKNTDSDSSTYIMKKNTNMMSYADITYGGNKYRAVKINTYRPSSVIISSSTTSGFQKNSGFALSTVYYFKYEPLKWVVLDASTGYVVTKDIIDSQPYNAYYKRDSASHSMNVRGFNCYANNYCYSTIHDWLNADSSYYSDYSSFNFYNTAFSSSEKGAITKTTCVNNAYDSDFASNSTKDYVFLMSDTEFNSYKSAFSSVALNVTDYTTAQGKASANKYWYLRTAAAAEVRVYYVAGGTATYSSSDYSRVDSTITGIRPAMKINLSSSYVKPDSGSSTTTYTLTYSANGGSGAPASQTGNGNITLSSTKPTRSGYTFLGWSTSSTATSASYSAGGTYNLTSNTTLYAVWKVNATNYTLTYNANGGSGAPASQTGNGNITLSSTKPTRSGYTFLGWSTSSTATSASYSAGGTYNLTSNTTLYAVWKVNATNYTLTYNANGGSGAPASQTGNGNITLSSTKPTRSGYTFLGWSTSSTATSASYSAGGTYNLTSNTTLYAVWKVNATNYTLTYNANGGSGAPASQTGNGNITLSSTKPTRSGYTFLGWSTSSTATTATYAAGNSFYLSSNTTLYAVWSANTTTYTVTYNANGGIVTPPTASAVSGNSVTLPTPTRNGYTCLGWSTSKTATSASYACGSSYKPTSNVILYAVWKVKSTPQVKDVTVTEKANIRYIESTTITANVNADAGANYTVEWSSSNTKVATVDASGKVTGTKKFGTGTATITCVVTDKNTGKSVSDDCEVTVNFVWWQWIIGIVLFGWIWY